MEKNNLYIICIDGHYLSSASVIHFHSLTSAPKKLITGDVPGAYISHCLSHMTTIVNTLNQLNDGLNATLMLLKPTPF
jgi:hypothetical protein